MQKADSHLSDSDLILAADGELDFRRAGRVREHLEACWVCRSRQAELQGAVAEYVSAYRGELDAALPAPEGPRALLRSQLLSAAAAGGASSHWKWATVLAAAAVVIFLAWPGGSGGDLSEPRNFLTPGETRTTALDDVCRVQDGGNRIVPVSLREQVFQEYGISGAHPNSYEVDYLITPALGGADSIRNLWPQPYSTVWNAHVKDELEDQLHELVCAGKVDLGTAQREIATDWIAAYKKYFRTDRPL